MLRFRASAVKSVNLWFTKSSRASGNLIRGMCNSITISSKPILYGDEASPPVRFVLVTAKLLGVDLEVRKIDLFKGENKTEFYKKITPLQKVPVLSVDREIICDSHAIVLYLCRKTDDKELYPSDNMLRTKVDQMLYFNASTLFSIDSAIFSEYFAGIRPADETKVAQWYSAIDYLEHHLKLHKWLAGDQIRICDICCATTLSSLGIIYPPLAKHVKVKEWMKNLDRMSAFEINRRGVRRLQSFVEKYDHEFVKNSD